MSSRVANNQISPFFTTMELDDLSRASQGASPSLGQLLKHVGDVRKEATGDGGETPTHHALDLSDASIEPRSLPFVLSFTNLTYSVKVHRKFSLLGMFSSERSSLGAATELEPIGGESLLTRTKTMLNDISGEAREEEKLVSMIQLILISLGRFGVHLKYSLGFIWE
ncbi:unnamed protein product [Prunus armeniaca]|uniref:Uncharacterized protein n=1 Tax=Prunus armeniaca TaxID=36596 RepID=A0A6J5U3A1_PRUAR|nr:unnamed protein product [Prunus armeniaca]